MKKQTNKPAATELSRLVAAYECIIDAFKRLEVTQTARTCGRVKIHDRHEARVFMSLYNDVYGDGLSYDGETVEVFNF